MSVLKVGQVELVSGFCSPKDSTGIGLTPKSPPTEHQQDQYGSLNRATCTIATIALGSLSSPTRVRECRQEDCYWISPALGHWSADKRASPMRLFFSLFPSLYNSGPKSVLDLQVPQNLAPAGSTHLFQYMSKSRHKWHRVGLWQT